jgi:Transcriptional regulator, AbiEi antitoxin
MAAESRTRRLDRAVAALAERRHGVVAWVQLARLGMSRDELRTRVAAGRLHRLHRGVYAVVAPRLLRIEGHWLAAVLAVGDGAVLSHRSAAALWDLLPAPTRAPEVAVARNVKPRAGIHLHCLRSLPNSQITTRNSVPCTTVARTIVDLASVVPPRRLERALGEAEVLRLYDRNEIETILAAHPRRPGSRTIRALLGGPDPSTTRTRTPLEEQFLALCDRAGFRRPECNVPFTLPDGTEISIDAFWRSTALAVELDSRGFHSNWRAQVKDRRRDAQLVLAGLKPLRFTEADLARGANTTIAILRELLRLAPAPIGAAPPRARR